VHRGADRRQRIPPLQSPAPAPYAGSSDGSKFGVTSSELRAAGGGLPDRLLAFHVCDWLVPTRDLLSDRGMMGDGLIDIPRIRG